MATMVMTMQGADPELYSPKELAKILGCSRKKVYRLLSEGVIKFIQLDHQKRIPRSEKERILHQGIPAD